MKITSDVDDTELGYWIALTRVSRMGPRRIPMLVDAFGSARGAWEATSQDLISAGLDRRTTDNLIQTRPRIDPSIEVPHLKALGAVAITRRDPRYPPLLAEIYDPPPVLYVRGTLDEPDTQAIAMVGTRRASTYGKQAAERIAGDLGRAGVTVVSGLALGIDGASHRGALAAGGRTIAVLGNGLDRVYPSQHTGLAADIAHSGALVTEFPIGTKPDAMNFPRRNRVISGLTSGTLVVEAPLRSGALSTAGFATEQGRDVMAVPGSIFSPMSEGAHALIKDGAKTVTCADDILAELRPSSVARQIVATELLPLDDVERAILQALGHEPMHIDDIAHEAALPMTIVSSALTLMELKELVRATGGMNYVRGIH